MDIPSHNDLFQIGRNEVLLRNADIRSDQVDRDGADVNVLTHVGAGMAEEIVNVQVRAFNKLLVGQATGADLDKLAMDRYGISRKAAAPALGTVRFSRPTANYGALVIPADTRIATSSGIEFATLTAISMGAGIMTPAYVQGDVQAVVAGAAGNVTAGTITRVISVLPDSSITVTNPSRTAGGDEEEDDSAFRQRIKRYYVESRRATVSALEGGAMTVPGIRQAVANEITEPDHSPARYVQMYIADKDGYASTALISSVQTALEEYRAAGIKVDILGGAPYFQDVQIEIAFPTGVNQSQIASDVRWAIVNSINGLAPGETLLASSIIAAARSVRNAIVGRIVAPTGNVVPSSEQVIRTSYDRVQIVVIVSPGGVYQNTDKETIFGIASTIGTVVP